MCCIAPFKLELQCPRLLWTILYDTDPPYTSRKVAGKEEVLEQSTHLDESEGLPIFQFIRCRHFLIACLKKANFGSLRTNQTT